MPISEKTLQFLMENRIRDSKDWYEAHKDEYRALVRQPLLELAQALTPVAAAIDPLLETRPSRCVSRVRRDTRFSKDKTLYRDVMWVAFERERTERCFPPGLFFEFSPAGFRYGCGYYKAPPANMERLRQMVMRGDARYRRAQRAYDAQDVFGMEGDCYKRPRCADAPAKQREWLERRSIAFVHNSKDFALLFSDALAGRLAADFSKLREIYGFLLATSLPPEE